MRSNATEGIVGYVFFSHIRTEDYNQCCLQLIHKSISPAQPQQLRVLLTCYFFTYGANIYINTSSLRNKPNVEKWNLC